MVGHRLIDRLIDAPRRCAITTFCEEPRAAYDRVNLTKFFAGEDLSLVDPHRYRAADVDLLVGDKAIAIDRAARTVTSSQGRTLPYDRLVLATGSYPFVPPIAGRDATGCFVYRTIDDLD